MPKEPNKDLTLDYRKPPAPTGSYSTFSERIERTVDRMWDRAARDFVMMEPGSAPPAYWEFTIRTSDFWRYRTPEKNPVPARIARIPDFEEILACGHWVDLFGIYELPLRELSRRGMLTRPPRTDVQYDLVSIWQYATTDSNRALPLSQAETPDEARDMLITATRELGLDSYVGAYASGVPMEDLLIG